MTKSFLLAALLTASVGSLAGCGYFPAVAPPQAAPMPDPAALASSFVPYCGPVWSVGKQGYINIPCPPGSNYPGADAQN
jgi:hypothetical protein